MQTKEYTQTDLKIQHENEKQIILELLGARFTTKQFIIEHTCADMFINKLYKKLYNIIKGLYNDNIEIIDQNIIEKLDAEEQKELVINLDKEYITEGGYKYHLEKLQNAYIQRLFDNCRTLEDSEKIKKIKEKYSLRAQTRPIWEETQKIICDYVDKWENKNIVKTYYPHIDNVIGSLQGGDIFILAGATGMGKTCMMLNLLLNMAKHGKKCLLFSLEMTAEQLQNRIICAETGINSNKYRGFNMNETEWNKYQEYANSKDFKGLPIDICTNQDITIDKIKTIVNESPADIVLIDYLGLINGGKGLNSYERMSEISRELKTLATSTNKPFIILHQLNRMANDRTDKRPQLSDLRDSGKIEQDADFITFVYRPAYYENGADARLMEFIVRKNRHGAIGNIIRLDFDGASQKIKEYSATKTEQKNILNVTKYSNWYEHAQA